MIPLIVILVLRSATVQLGGGSYLVAAGRPTALVASRNGVVITPVAGRTVCPVAGLPGTITVSSDLSIHGQAKALVHEVVHAAVDCDARAIPDAEKVAEAEADLFDSVLGPFVIEGLKR